MKYQKIMAAAGALALLYLGWRGFGWPGVALVGGGVVFWIMLHVTRFMLVMQRAAVRPKGYVGSAVMLNARLQPGMNLMTLVSLTRSLGEPVSQQPEIWRWSDDAGSYVDCEFADGKLVRHTLVRPAQPDDAPPAGSPTPAP